MSNFAKRTRPKGYNLKVWLALFEEAEQDKKWVHWLTGAPIKAAA
jgi:hypothetical protein